MGISFCYNPYTKRNDGSPHTNCTEEMNDYIHSTKIDRKIGPLGPELIWYLATKCKIGRQ